MRQNEFDLLLDECLDRLERGETISDCLVAHPEHAQQLAPLLRAATLATDSLTWQPSVEATGRARARFRSAVAARERDGAATKRLQPSWFERLTARPLTVAAIASLSVIALTTLLVVGPLELHMTQTPGVPPEQQSGTASPQPGTTPTPSSTTTPSPTTTQQPVDATPDSEPVVAAADEGGNFAFYLSDAPNDIGDFSSLVITIESIQLKPVSGGRWVRIEPTTTVCDLVQLQGDLAQELWRGQVPPGDYTTVFLNVSAIDAALASSAEEPYVSLPSDTLHVISDFSVGQQGRIEFVFDITVHRTANGASQYRYILSPQAAESGVGHAIQPITPVMPGGDSPGKHEGRDDAPTPAAEETPDIDRPHPSPGPGWNSARTYGRKTADA